MSKERKGWWVFNLLPVAALIWFLHTIPFTEIPNSLGFGVGVAITIMVLAVIFIKADIPGGFGVNFLLLGFVLLSYYLPQIDASRDERAPFFHFVVTMGIPLSQAVLAMFLTSYLEVKPGNSDESRPSLVNYYFRPLLYFTMLGTLGAFSLKRSGSFNFSTVFTGAQCLAWFCIWTALCILGFPARLDFDALQNFIIQEKRLSSRVNQATIVYLFLSCLLLCTFFEAFRGLWVLWGLTALAAVFMFASLWRLWSFAFPPGTGPGWGYFEVLGGYLEQIRNRTRKAEVKEESAISAFVENHPIFTSIYLILLFVIVFLNFSTHPILSFLGILILAWIINYLLRNKLKKEGILPEGKLPFNIGLIFAMTVLSLIFFLYLLIFIIRQSFFG